MRRLSCLVLGLLFTVACTKDEPSTPQRIIEEPAGLPPTLTSASLGDGPFTIDSTITVTLGKAADPDGDEVTFKFQWYVNGTAEPGAVGESFSGAFAKGDEVYVAVIPTDGTNDGEAVESETVTIANTPPVMTSVTLGAGPFYRTTTLSAIALTSDADGDAVTLSYRWLVDGTEAAGANGASLAGVFSAGDSISVEAIPNDGEDDGASLVSSAVVIANALPSIPGVVMMPALVRQHMWVEVVTASTDPEGDPITYSYAWYRNDVLQGYPATQTVVTGSNLVDGDTWRVEAVANDGLAASAPGVSQRSVSRGTQIAVGYNHACAITTEGYVKCWGSNLKGQLGDGTTISYATAVTVAGITNAESVVAGTEHGCALEAGAVKCWGANDYGQLGNGDTTQQLNAVNVSGLTTGAQAIAAGMAHTCALVNGGVKCWGMNYSGQLGNGSTLQQVAPVDVVGLTSGAVAVAAGSNHSCAIATGGGVKCWGKNSSGQLGNAAYTDQKVPVDVVGLSSNVKAVTTGRDHTCALTTGGAVKCWGANTYGQLGNATFTGQATPVAVDGLSTGVMAIAAGHLHTCAIVAGGELKCWGYNSNGQLGNGNATNQAVPTGLIGAASGYQAIAASFENTCALAVDDTVKCWGYNGQGQLGNGNTGHQTTAVHVTGVTGTAAAIAAGEAHTCTANTGGGVSCWGANWNGQLGTGDTDLQLAPTAVSGLTSGVVSITAGGRHTCALVGGSLKCWGQNTYGQLGDGTKTDRAAAIAVSGLTANVQAVVAGSRHTCAVMTGGDLKCWGYNWGGQLGNGTTTDQSAPIDVTGSVLAVAAGDNHSCAIVTGGAVKCWGYNASGQVGNGTTTNQLTPVNVSGLASGVQSITAGGYHTCALTTGGGVKCWGSNNLGQLGTGDTNQRLTPVDVSGLTSGVLAIDAGSGQTCALINGGGIKCWGYNGLGQLGNGTTTQQNSPMDVTGLASGVQMVVMGSGHSCALTGESELRCWGSNTYGQLGVPELSGYYPYLPVLGF